MSADRICCGVVQVYGRNNCDCMFCLCVCLECYSFEPIFLVTSIHYHLQFPQPTHISCSEPYRADAQSFIMYIGRCERRQSYYSNSDTYLSHSPELLQIHDMEWQVGDPTRRTTFITIKIYEFFRHQPTVQHQRTQALCSLDDLCL